MKKVGYRGSCPVEYVVLNMSLRVMSSFDIIKAE